MTAQTDLIHLDATWQLRSTWYIWTQPDSSAQLDTSGHNLTAQPNLIHLDTTWELSPTWYIWTQTDSSAQLDTSGHNLTAQPNLIHLDTTWQLSPTWYIWTQTDSSAQLKHGKVFFRRERPLWTPHKRNNALDRPLYHHWQCVSVTS
jgi:hypothetical protein